jgi:hypothetical protein
MNFYLREGEEFSFFHYQTQECKKFHAICFQQESISVLNYKEIVSGIQKPIVKSILSFDYECELIWFNASYANNKKDFTIASLDNGKQESHKQKALSQQSIRGKNKLKFPKKHQKQQNTLKKFLEIYEDQRPIKTVKRSLSFLVTIFNRSDERKSIKMNPKSEEKG